MDRRIEPRMAVALPVEIWRQGSLLARSTSIDLSRNGLCVRSAGGELRARALVDVVIAVDGESFRQRALVEYVAVRRAGLLFADEADVLWGLLQERRTAARGARGAETAERA